MSEREGWDTDIDVTCFITLSHWPQISDFTESGLHYYHDGGSVSVAALSIMLLYCHFGDQLVKKGQIKASGQKHDLKSLLDVFICLVTCFISGLHLFWRFPALYLPDICKIESGRSAFDVNRYIWLKKTKHLAYICMYLMYIFTFNRTNHQIMLILRSHQVIYLSQYGCKQATQMNNTG